MLDVNKLRKPSRGKGAPPPPEDTALNLTKPASNDKVPLQVKISPEVRRHFRAYAADHDVELSTLFVTMWDYYKANHG